MNTVKPEVKTALPAERAKAKRVQPAAKGPNAPNANRPGYKETKVGWIPKDWDCLPLGKLFSHSKERGVQGLPTFSVTVDRGLVPRAEINRKMAPDLPPDKSLVVREQYIAYNMMRMWQGSVAVADKSCVVSPAYVVCRPKGNVSSEFMFHYFKSHLGLHNLWAYSYGITDDRLRLYFSDFALVSAPVPPIREQVRIAEIISTCQTAIERTAALIASKQLQKKAIMQQLLTGRRRLPGFKGRWKKFRLGDLFTERTEAESPDLPLLAITGTRGVIPASEITRKDSSSSDKSRYKVIYPGDIGYNTMRMWQGVSAVSALKGIVSPAYTICIPSGKIDAMFMGYFFKFAPVIHVFWRYSQGLVDDTLSLKFHNLAAIQMTIPDRKEQTEIAQVLAGADQAIDLLQQKLRILQNQKKALMQKLLTGQVRVKV